MIFIILYVCGKFCGNLTVVYTVLSLLPSERLLLKSFKIFVLPYITKIWESKSIKPSTNYATLSSMMVAMITLMTMILLMKNRIHIFHDISCASYHAILICIILINLMPFYLCVICVLSFSFFFLILSKKGETGIIVCVVSCS